jgi:hypothetical protein
MSIAPIVTPQQRFLSLLKHDILKLELAELDFGIYRILNYRRAQVLAYLDDTLPGRIDRCRRQGIHVGTVPKKRLQFRKARAPKVVLPHLCRKRQSPHSANATRLCCWRPPQTRCRWMVN